jgi:hypothetical protein
VSGAVASAGYDGETYMWTSQYQSTLWEVTYDTLRGIYQSTLWEVSYDTPRGIISSDGYTYHIILWEVSYDHLGSVI